MLGDDLVHPTAKVSYALSITSYFGNAPVRLCVILHTDVVQGLVANSLVSHDLGSVVATINTWGWKLAGDRDAGLNRRRAC